MDSGGDDWFALDKLHHFLFCFSLTIVFATAAARIRYPFLRSHRVCLASLSSLSAGAAKEVADELGFFHSSGASVKDFSADILGTAVAHLGGKGKSFGKIQEATATMRGVLVEIAEEHNLLLRFSSTSFPTWIVTSRVHHFLYGWISIFECSTAAGHFFHAYCLFKWVANLSCPPEMTLSYFEDDDDE